MGCRTSGVSTLKPLAIWGGDGGSGPNCPENSISTPGKLPISFQHDVSGASVPPSSPCVKPPVEGVC